jgi:hypothetical protein
MKIAVLMLTMAGGLTSGCGAPCKCAQGGPDAGRDAASNDASADAVDAADGGADGAPG